MISNFREGGGRFSKIGESLCNIFFSIGGKSEIGGRGVKMTPKYRISFMDGPLVQFVFLQVAFLLRLTSAVKLGTTF